MNPPVTTLRRGTRATYPTPSGRHVDYPPHIHHAASSLQFGDGSHQYGKNPEQWDTAVYGQYRKTYGGQHAQCSATTLRRKSEDGKRRVSFEDDHVNAARQTRQRPRSANVASQREVIHVFPFSEKHDERLHQGRESQQDPYARGTAGRSGHRTVQRPRSVTMASQSERVYSSTTEQQRMHWTETAKKSQYSARPPDESGYNRAGYLLNQAPPQRGNSGNPTAQDTAYSGDYRASSTSHGATYSNTNRQQTRDLQNGYEQMNPVEYSKANVANTQNAYAPAPESPEYVTMSRPHASGAVNYNAQSVVQQRTTYRARNDQRATAQQGYEQMAPLYFNPPVPHSAVGFPQNGASYSAGTTQQNGVPYSAAGSQQNGTPYRVSTKQQNGTPYGAVPSQHTGTPYSSAASSPNRISYSATRAQLNGIAHNAAGTQRNEIPYSTATSQQNGIPYSTPASQWNGTQYDAAGMQQNGTPYSASTTKQNRPPHSTHQHAMPHSTAASQCSGIPYNTIAGAIPQHCMSYSTAPSQQNGTSYSVAATQKNVAYSAAHHQGGHEQGGSPQSYSSTPQQNGYDSYNGTPAAPQHNGYDGYNGTPTVPQHNGYDGYDSSSDSEFDEVDDQYDYVNLRQWHDAENGSNSSANQDDR